MSKTDPRIDAYIAKAAEFAKPILEHFRTLVHKACPDAEETIKWSMPAFDYNGALCQIAAFKAHCFIVFWKAALMKDADRFAQKEGGYLRKITSLKDLPSDKIMIALIKEAAALNASGKKLPAKPKLVEPLATATPDYFIKALKKNKKAFTTFEAFAPSHRKEYNQWITEAKTEETRNKRMDQAIEWIAEGKGRNWKYEKR